YVNFLCSIGYDPKTIQVITKAVANCATTRKSQPGNLNYPSISAIFSSSGKGVTTKSFIRTVTNVGAVNSVYRPKIESPRGVTISVKPTKLVFTETVKKLSFAVFVTMDSHNMVMDDSGGLYGYLSWVDGKHVVRSPIVVSQINPL
ncbi:hypothetical protein MKX03_007989, partial [Papaver bracteatum]